jgi:putative two-component system response regulator
MLLQDQKKAAPTDDNPALDLQSAILITMCNLVEYPNDLNGKHVERSEQFLGLLIEEMIKQGVYQDELNSWDIKVFLQAVSLHDVGKVAIHDNILMKPSPLTVDEFTEMKKHTTYGEMIIEKMQKNTRKSAFLYHARIIAGTHHEKWDGTGYPRGLAGAAIPLQGRLMAIMDVYDALITDKPYKKALPIDEAIRVITAGSGKYFDPALMDGFLAAAHRFHN